MVEEGKDICMICIRSDESHRTEELNRRIEDNKK